MNIDFENYVVPEPDRFGDLLQFAKLELETGDLEPWAALLRAVKDDRQLSNESALWLVKLYNAFDGMYSTWGAFRRWPYPGSWNMSADKEEIRNFPHMQERRNLHGGRGIIRFQSYCDALDLTSEFPQQFWLMQAINSSGSKEQNFKNMLKHVRNIWGVGRQSSFEWVEFLNKVLDYPVTAPDAELWESSGPRQSLELLYGNETPTLRDLNGYAHHCRKFLSGNGVHLPWEDFETVICDFKVMRKGRYYPGRHLAEIREEIEQIRSISETDCEYLISLFKSIIPEPWNTIAPGIDDSLMPYYKQNGVIRTPFS